MSNLSTGKFSLESQCLAIYLPTETAWKPTPTTKFSLPKKCVYFPITNTIRKQWTSFITCRPLPKGCGREKGHVTPKNIVQLCWTKWLFKNFDWTTLGKNEHEKDPLLCPFFLTDSRLRWVSCPPTFQVTKRSLEVYFPFKCTLTILYDHYLDTSNSGKQIN